jgi:glycosyltransferase involved in cell wall biosynthesis
VRRVLVVAYYFPPLGGVGSLRVAGFARHLPEHGWEPIVLAPRSGAYHRDPELGLPQCRIVRTRSLELSRLGKRALRAGGDDVRAAPVRGARRGLRTLARRILYRPDPQVGWYLPAVREGRRALGCHPVDAILSSSFPITAHLVARRLQRATGLPWVADFRDPWSEMLPPGAARRRAARLERALANEAAEVVMTSPSWARRHAELWGRPVRCVPNGHDLDGVAPDPPERFVLSYAGSFYPETQDLSTLWPAIAGDGPAGARVDTLRFIGDLHPALAAQLVAHGLLDRTEVTGFLPHTDATASMLRSSALLVAGPANARGILRGQVAAKIFEYLATGLPIVYVGDPQSDAADLLRAHAGCHLVATGDVEGARRALVAARAGPHERDVAALSRRSRTAALAQVLDGVVG